MCKFLIKETHGKPIRNQKKQVKEGERAEQEYDTRQSPFEGLLPDLMVGRGLRGVGYT